jgi:hypothetical protein
MVYVLRRRIANDLAVRVCDERSFAHIQQDERITPRVSHNHTAADVNIERRLNDRATRPHDYRDSGIGGVYQQIHFHCRAFRLEDNLGVGIGHP